MAKWLASFHFISVEVYPRPDGTIYICGIGGSDYITKDELKGGAFRQKCEANPARVEAAMASFRSMSSLYDKEGELDRMQACMRPCPPDAMPYMGSIPSYEGACTYYMRFTIWYPLSLTDHCMHRH